MQKMSLHEALYTPRAIRNFTPYPVSDATVATILDAAVRAIDVRGQRLPDGVLAMSGAEAPLPQD